MKSIGVGQSDIGRKRESNEDKLLVDDELGLYVVSDGMGGHAAGEVASELAIRSIHSYVAEQEKILELVRRSPADAVQLLSLAEKAVKRACREIYLSATSELEYAGMGCTVTMLLIAGMKAAMAHVGDTRLYLCRDKVVHQLSSDHTVAADLARSGAIQAEQVREHRYRHVLTRVVGTQESVEVDTLPLDLLPGDRFLLCTDGLVDYLREDDWLAGQMTMSNTEAIPLVLIDHANAEGGKDNITVLLTYFEEDAEKTFLPAATEQFQVSLDALGSVFLFEGLSLAHLARVLEVSSIRSFRKGQIVIKEGETCSTLFIVISGKLALSGPSMRSVELVPGDYLGETTLLKARPCRSTLMAATESQLLILDREPLMALLRSRSKFGVLIFERLGRYLSTELSRATEGNQSGRSTRESLHGAPVWNF